MEVSGKLHAPVVLPPEKKTSSYIEYEAWWASGPVWMLPDLETQTRDVEYF